MSDIDKSLMPVHCAGADFATCDKESELTPTSPGLANPSKVDGAGEPCPAPLMWQEIRDNYLRESIPWEIVRGSHRLVGRSWGQGPPIYFLNNFVGTAELYCLILWLLKDRYRCVVFDTMTSDCQSARRTAPTISEFARDVIAIADGCGDRQFDLYGAGFGAAVALRLMIDSPARITRAVLQHGFASRKLTWFERTLASLCLRSKRTLDHLPQRRRFQAVNHKPWFPPFDSSRFDFLIQSTGRLSLRDLARRAIAVKSFDLKSKLRQIDVPVLLLRTEGEGRVASDSQDTLEKQIRGVQVEWMHSAGQHPCLTHPHRVAKIVDAFLSSSE